ncbi:hypothetical protein ATY81_27285 [Rhizobium sp. R72]|uniref:hypothetical protein n=1 Tax=unclassified Rhizobium TaxID=2613769 RepID=UPI000B632561|nr:MULTISPECIES: hypothetical protein [unclassified Rhizobium]OWV98101.1 hypothetical protein ATY81_27285 [Rhizobium sp. R72]OWV98126.1 hypothetical protein ATY80_27285 [Rhizobium sp. R711]
MQYNHLVIKRPSCYNRCEEGVDRHCPMERTEFSTPIQRYERRTLIDIDEAHRPYLAAAILRFNAMNAVAKVELSTQITLFDDGSSLIDVLISDFQHCLYRGKIYTETLPLRRALISGVLGR